MAEIDKQAIIDQAIAAEGLRTDPAFAEAVLQLRRDAVDALVSSNPTDADAVRRHQADIRAIDGLAGAIASMIQRGNALKRAAPPA